MKERITKLKTDATTFWKSRSKKQRAALIGSFVGIIALAGIITYITTRTTMVPLFTELSAKETGEIAEVLASQGVTYEIGPGGTNILVPEEQVDALKVSLAAQGYPESGDISTKFFTENAGFGMTDNEFNVIKHAALETELENLIKTIDGVKDANVMLTMPEKTVFINDTEGQQATAAVILNTEPGHKFTDEQITTLYNLVAKSVPNLTTDNITISNQYSEYYDLETASSGNGSIDSIEGQMNVKKTIERDLQRQVQQMLGTMIGRDKVVVSVTTDIDFKKENREENLVEPVDEENMEGIEISAQRITETYSGMGADGGLTEMGTSTDNGTEAYGEVTSGNGDYERIEETINNEVNRINRVIQESPYKIRDIGIQVMVEPPQPKDVNSLPDEAMEDIEKILATIVRTSIDKEAAGELTDDDIKDKIVVSVQPFYGADAQSTSQTPTIPWWVWVVGGILVAAILLLVIFIFRSNKRKNQITVDDVFEEPPLFVNDINDEKETETTLRRKQLEKMAKEKPEDFAKLLRSWISED